MRDINLLDVLEKVQLDLEQNRILEQAESILQGDSAKEVAISEKLTGTVQKAKANINLSMLDQERMFDLESIEKICTDFRLRFLESTLFKDDVPDEAIREIKRIEANTGVVFEHFKIIAPEKRFNLADSTKDPILLAELPNGKFYYIFQWGNDMEWYQYFLKYPFRHMGTLAATSLAFGLLIALLVPSQFDSAQSEFFFRFFMFSMSSCLVMTLAIITAIMYSKDFSENVWNSRFIK